MYFLPYLFVFFVLFIFSFPISKISIEGSQRQLYNNRLNEIGAFFILVLFLGFRGYIFSDIFSYHSFYDKVPSFINDSVTSKYFKTNGWEKGYLLYALICKVLFPNYWMFQFVSTLVDFLLFKKLVNDYLPSKSRKLAYLFFYVFYGLIIEINLLRNVKAILIFLVALRYVGVNFIKYFILILIACFFHKFSIIYLILYPLLNKKWSRKLVLCVWIFGNVFFLLQIPILKNIVLNILNYLPSNIYFSTIKNYFSSDLYSKAYGIGFGWIERQICFLISFHYSKKLYNNDDKSRIFFNLFYIYSFIFLYFSEISIVVERVPYLFAAGYWFLFPYIFNFLSKKEKKTFLIYFFAVSVMKVITGNNNILSNYKIIFFDNYEQRENIFYKNINKILGI